MCNVDKRSSLLDRGVDYGGKKFYNEKTVSNNKKVLQQPILLFLSFYQTHTHTLSHSLKISLPLSLNIPLPLSFSTSISLSLSLSLLIYLYS